MTIRGRHNDVPWERDPRRKVYAERFGLNEQQVSYLFRGTAMLNQLDHCGDDATRRLLLGISEKYREQGNESPQRRGPVAGDPDERTRKQESKGRR